MFIRSKEKTDLICILEELKEKCKEIMIEPEFNSEDMKVSMDRAYKQTEMEREKIIESLGKMLVKTPKK